MGNGAFKFHYASAPRKNKPLHLYHRIYSWSCLTCPSVPEMKYRSSTGENSSRPERVEHRHFFFFFYQQSANHRTARLARGVSSPQSHLELAFMQIIVVHYKRREEVGHERVCCSKRKRKCSKERSARNMKACVHL